MIAKRWMGVIALMALSHSTPTGRRYTLLTLEGFRNDRYQDFEVV